MIGGVIATLKGGTLWAVVAVILAILGSVTYLASSGDVTGTDALGVIGAVLVAVTGVTSAHVAGQTAAAAFNTPAPGPNVPPTPPPAPGPTSLTPGMVPNAAPNAMPQPQA